MAFWDDIGAKLNRKPLNVYKRWVNVIQPVLTRHIAGVLDVDFKPILIDYMVENGLKFAQDVDWKALTKLPEFRGLNITFYYVSPIIFIFSRHHNYLSPPGSR